MAKSKSSKEVFAYQTGTRISLIVIILLLALIMVMAFFDSATWYWGLPVISLILVPIIAYYLWVIWQDSGQKVTVTREEIIWEKGAGRCRRHVNMSWKEIGQMQDDTRIFTIGRRFRLVSSARPDESIRIDSSLSQYKDLLRVILARMPGGAVSDRAKKSLAHMRLL